LCLYCPCPSASVTGPVSLCTGHAMKMKYWITTPPLRTVQRRTATPIVGPNVVYFATYIPLVHTTAGCVSRKWSGSSRFYLIMQRNGRKPSTAPSRSNIRLIRVFWEIRSVTRNIAKYLRCPHCLAPWRRGCKLGCRPRQLCRV
jgi:hypothetical protein